MDTVDVTRGFGEVMAPQVLVTCLMVSPDGTATVDPGALHGRSAIESSVQFVGKREDVVDAQLYWCLWVAMELDASDKPMRYRGAAASELWIDPLNKRGYKVLAESVNRMAEAMRGGLNLKTIDARSRTSIRQQLLLLAEDVWERSAASFKEALLG
jgi:hypothetical protein